MTDTEAVVEERRFGPELSTLPVVSVLMITYNHERFIRQAIESVFMQQADFPIELVIGEDRSTDETLAKIERICAAAPICVRLLTSDHNAGMHGNFLRTLSACKGAFVAMLEGDDYWIHSRKLALQVQLTETLPNVQLVGGYTLHLKPSGGVSSCIPDLNTTFPLTPGDFMLDGCNIHTSSMLFRNGAWFLSSETLSSRKNLWLDYSLKLLLADRGEVAFVAEIVSVYRTHSGGVSFGFNENLYAWLQSKIHALQLFDRETKSRNHAFVADQIAADQARLAEALKAKHISASGPLGKWLFRARCAIARRLLPRGAAIDAN